MVPGLLVVNLLLSPDVSKEDKVRGLTERYNVPVRGDVEEGVRVMCNLSDYVWERGVEKGMEGKLADLVLANLRQGRRPEEFASYLGLTVEQAREIERKALAAA